MSVVQGASSSANGRARACEAQRRRADEARDVGTSTAYASNITASELREEAEQRRAQSRAEQRRAHSTGEPRAEASPDLRSSMASSGDRSATKTIINL